MKISFGNSYSPNQSYLNKGKIEFKQLDKNRMYINNSFINKKGLFNRAENTGVTSVLEQMIKEKTDDVILQKIARGESLTPAEREIAKKIDPNTLRKAEEANRQRQELETKLKSAKTDKEAKELIFQAKAAAVQVARGPQGDQLLAGLILEGIDEAERKYHSKDWNEEGSNGRGMIPSISFDKKG